ncbi:MAG: DUF6705 family protein [Bacteroidota bacterium]
MKTNIKLLILFFTINTFGQQIVNLSTYNSGSNNNKYFKDLNNVYPNYVGTWEYFNESETFRVILTKKTRSSYDNIDTGCFIDEIQGHFMLIENAGQPNETIIYTSDKEYLNSGENWISAILLIPYSNTTRGTIIDNCIEPTLNETNKMGMLKFTINTATVPYTAHWEVIERQGLRILNGPIFKVPLDIILTKR